MKLKQLLRVNEVDSTGINPEFLNVEVRYLDRFSHGEIQRYLESSIFREDLESEVEKFNDVKENGFFHFTKPEHSRLSIRADGAFG